MRSSPLLSVIVLGLFSLGLKADSKESPTAVETALYEKINTHREKRHLDPLVPNPDLAAVARAHSQAMAEHRVAFGHDGFSGRLRAVSQFLPHRGGAENVASFRGYDDVAAIAFKEWLESAGHRGNIEGPFHLTGIGVVCTPGGEWYLTQLFIKSLPE